MTKKEAIERLDRLEELLVEERTKMIKREYLLPTVSVEEILRFILTGKEW